MRIGLATSGRTFAFQARALRRIAEIDSSSSPTPS
jgi:hypothetical protein